MSFKVFQFFKNNPDFWIRTKDSNDSFYDRKFAKNTKENVDKILSIVDESHNVKNRQEVLEQAIKKTDNEKKINI